MQKELKNKQIIKIPNNVKIFYCGEKKIIIFKGIEKQRSLKISDLLSLKCHPKHIELEFNHKIKLSNSNKKKIYMIKKTTASLIKQLLIESAATVCQALKLVGVGFRAFPVENFENQLLLLKLGYSHPIYFRIPNEIKISTLKFTKLFMSGYSYQQLQFTASKIRSNKIPEPYKGKGILYENEKITLKEGKKV